MFMEKNPASTHDSIPMITAIAHMLDINPSLKPKNMCFDAAGDGEPNHELLLDFDIRPFIKRISHFKKADKVDLPKAKTAPNGIKEHFNKDGVPVCMAGVAMPRNGYDKKSKASMFRCPLANRTYQILSSRTGMQQNAIRQSLESSRQDQQTFIRAYTLWL